MSEQPDYSHLTSGTSKAKSWLQRITIKQWIAAAIVIVVLVFILQNRESVRIELFFGQMYQPLWLTLGVTFGLGWLVGAFSFRRRK